MHTAALLLIRMSRANERRTLIAIWLAWAAIVVAFQAIAPMRFDIARPDRALPWTAGETRANSQNDKPYLIRSVGGIDAAKPSLASIECRFPHQPS